MVNFFRYIRLLLVGLSLSLLTFSAASAALVSADKKSWSGYWWPFRYGGLATGLDYRGNPAPLEKYELLTDGYLSGRLTTPYLADLYDPAAPGWYGLCYAWAAAATIENEPERPSVHDNILFRIDDKKGLYTLAHSGDTNIHADGQDPLMLHQWLTNTLGQQGRAFYADLAVDSEVWTYPVYAYEMTYHARVGNQQAVDALIFYASDLVEKDFVGIKQLWKNYTYDLTYADDGTIVAAAWTADSIADHPQLMSLVQEQQSLIAGLDIDLLRQLGAAADDEWESPGGLYLPPGSYQLVSADIDRYTLAGYAGDTLTVNIEKLAGPERPLTIEARDTQGVLLDQVVLTSRGDRLAWTLSGSPDHIYQLRISQNDYTQADFYRLDFNRRSLQEQVILPYLPGTGWWSGLALTNIADNAADGLCLTGLDSSGTALESHLEPQTLAARSKILSLFSNLPARSHEKSVRQSLAVSAPAAVAVVHLFGGPEDGLGGFFSTDSGPAKRIQLPFSSANWQQLTWGGLLNQSSSEQSVSCSVYREDGSFVGHQLITLPPYQKIKLSDIAVVANLPAGGWIDLAAQSQDNCLVGYQLWRSLADATKLEGLRGLVSSALQWLPHVDNAGIWSTALVLINPQSVPVTITLSLPAQTALLGASATQQVVLNPYEKRTLELNDLFYGATDELSRSAVKLTGSADFSGYLSYRTNQDLATIPLLQQSQLSSRLALPHLSVVSNWWTGVAIFNPSTQPVSVTLTPVKDDGVRWTEQEMSILLPAGEKQAFSIRGYWPAELAEQFSYLEISAPEGQEIGGLYLFGRNGAQQVAGSVLPSMTP